MKYKVLPTPLFEKDIEFYYRKRKYKNIRNDISPIIEELEKGNLMGKEIPGIASIIGNHTFKVRAVNTDTNVGKSNGYRLIYYAIKDDSIIFLLTLYYKKDDNKIPTDVEIVDFIKDYCL